MDIPVIGESGIPGTLAGGVGGFFMRKLLISLSAKWSPHASGIVGQRQIVRPLVQGGALTLAAKRPQATLAHDNPIYRE